MELDSNKQSRKCNELELPPRHGHPFIATLEGYSEVPVDVEERNPDDFSIEAEVVTYVVHPLARTSSAAFAHALIARLSQCSQGGDECGGMEVVRPDVVV